MWSVILLAAVQAAPATTVQQDFERATALYSDGKHAEAIAAWTALEPRVARNARTMAIVRGRKGKSLFALDRRDEAVAAARAALAAMPEGDKTLREDRYELLLMLGFIAERSLDYAGATALYAEAGRYADTPGQQLGGLLREAATATFVDPDQARAALARADTVLAGQKVEPAVLADFSRQRGLLLLNTGDVRGARKAADEAVRRLGGLTMRVDQRDVQARSDVALAALLAGDKEDARRYMAYTGAGRLGTDKSFSPGAVIAPPDCGGEAGLKPSDVAVVQFTVAPDGSVSSSQPIYAAGGGRVALEFARAASRWSWTPEQVTAMPPFFRNNVRVELRCSTAFERPSIRQALAGDLFEWLGTKGVPMPAEADGSAATRLPAQRAALAAAEAEAGNGLATVPHLYLLMTSPVVGREEVAVLGARAVAIVDKAGAPPLARLAVALPALSAASASGEKDGAFRARLEAMLAEPAYAGDAQARAVLRLSLAETYKPGQDRATVMLRQVADDAELPAKDPLKVGALARLASAENAAGRVDLARAAFEKSGLSADQCALVDRPPQMAKVGGTFPEEARQWGFEGWTQVQTDIAADGKPTNTRVVAAYPPFVFTEAGQETVATARYSSTFRPGGGQGCGGQTARVRFAMP